MKKLHQCWLSTIALCGVLGASPAWSMGPGTEAHRDPARMLERLSEHLELTGEQEQQVRDILAQDSEQARADRQELRSLRDALAQQRNNYDDATTRQLADQLGEVSARMAYDITHKYARVYQVLDEAQRAEFERLQAEREARSGRRFGKHRD